jgi:hypothetical protein
MIIATGLLIAAFAGFLAGDFVGYTAGFEEGDAYRVRRTKHLTAFGDPTPSLPQHQPPRT